MIRKNLNNTFTVDVTQGRTKRHQKRFKTRQEAVSYERHFLVQIEQGKAWANKPKDNRTLLELLNIWYELHGQNLKDGSRRKDKLAHAIRALNNPVAHIFNANDFAKYRAKRLKVVKPKTINNEHTYLVSLFNELKRLKEIDYANPLEELRTIKIPERELSYLSSQDIKKLLDVLKPCLHTYQATLICLSCGLRWGEALKLEPKHYKDNVLHLFNTKSGKNRYIPLKGDFDLPLDASVKTFTRCYKKAGIPKTQGQNTHILRHTFASHFVMNGGDILTLQKILGHSTLNMTMKYAHLSPDHLKDVLIYNPVVKMSLNF